MPRSGVDYATDNITVYRCCGFGCRYCWAWRIPLNASRIARGRYDPVKEAEKYLRKRGGRVIVVSFTSDPYQWEEERLQLTRRVLEVLSKARQHRVLILTKNPKLALRDLDLMLRHGDMWLGATVVSLERNEYEPLAPPPEDRLEALRQAKQRGVKTWLSIEPIIPSITYPEDIVEVTLGYVDWYVLGSLNYCRQLKLHSLTEGTLKLWYAAHVKSAVELLKKHGKQFHIKRELLKLIPFITGKCSECLHNYMDFCLEHREKVRGEDPACFFMEMAARGEGDR